MLPALALDELHRLKREQTEVLLKLGFQQDGDTLLCARADDDPMLPTTLTHEFAKVVGRAKDVPRVRLHDLRHSHATQLLLAGFHPKIAQERLGHSTISVTLDLYSHVTETMPEDAAARLDNAFRKGKTAIGSAVAIWVAIEHRGRIGLSISLIHKEVPVAQPDRASVS